MKEIELERTYLAKHLPDELFDQEYTEIQDSYFPEEAVHPSLRLRKNGEKYQITKKQPVEGNDSSKQSEDTVHLTKEEYEGLFRAGGKTFRKLRYYYPYNGRKAEVDVYQDRLKGLVVVDFEFENESDFESFVMPDFCLAEVTQEEFLAGGMLCGKSYEDIEQGLEKYNYQKV
jgi:CYTH domain-containing protein